MIKRKRNHIGAVKTDQGDWVRSRAEVGDYFVHKFENLFKSSNPVLSEEIDHLITRVVTLEENDMIGAIPTIRKFMTL